MSSLQVLVVVLVCILYNCVDASEISEERKKHHHYKHDLIYGGGLFYYLTFLAIKVKLVFVLGVIFTAILFAGKLFAVVKYAEQKSHASKEVYIEPSHPVFEYPHDTHEFSYPTEDAPPFRRYSTMNFRRKTGDLEGYRSVKEEGIFNKITKILMKMNLTERIFKEMKLDKADCRKKFVCESQWMAENISMFKIVMRLMSDSTFDSYKTSNKPESIEDCKRLYPDCDIK